MSPALLSGVAGIVQGARHALEPDHITAVATVMVRAPSPGRGVFYAGCWGLGHAAMLVLVGGPLVVLGVELPDRVTTVLELLVGAMLVYLGLRTLRESKHDHPAVDPKASALERGKRPFAIGVMHGLAGSGALAALIALAAPTVTAGLMSLALYAAGTVLGMVALALLAGPVLARAGKLPRLAPLLCRVAGVMSIVVGVVWAVRTLAGV
ncbi:MAG: sulfite exporter TauE/SafE family protein [Labilithrix sp.]|nr:sulfite exporter TauE/SafE family protein [Labilithrix sp.]MCW5813818.1 sulfite exporter TauE/SafE family protein [Labilithrix sp.]